MGKLIFCTVLHEVVDSVKQMNLTKGPNFIYSEKRLSRAKLVETCIFNFSVFLFFSLLTAQMTDLDQTAFFYL